MWPAIRPDIKWFLLEIKYHDKIGVNVQFLSFVAFVPTDLLSGRGIPVDKRLNRSRSLGIEKIPSPSGIEYRSSISWPRHYNYRIVLTLPLT